MNTIYDLVHALYDMPVTPVVDIKRLDLMRADDTVFVYIRGDTDTMIGFGTEAFNDMFVETNAWFNKDINPDVVVDRVHNNIRAMRFTTIGDKQFISLELIDEDVRTDLHKNLVTIVLDVRTYINHDQWVKQKYDSI